MAKLYERMQGVASQLLTKYDQGTVAYVPFVSGGDVEPDTYDSPIPLDGTATGVTGYLTPPIESGDIVVTCKVFGTDPDLSGLINIDAAQYQVVKVEQIPAAGTVVAWRIYARG